VAGDVPRTSARGGRRAVPATTGGVSPINAQNRALVEALRPSSTSTGIDLPVYWGNRNWHPFLADTVRQMAADGVRRAVAFVTSAYSSYSGCRQYREDIAAARAAVGDTAPSHRQAPPVLEPPRVRRAVPRRGPRCARRPRRRPSCRARLVFTAHSLPVSMAATSDYQAQLHDAVALVADAVAPELARDLVWQSRSGPPQVPWLEPDINDHLRNAGGEGSTRWWSCRSGSCPTTRR
jgi:protoporphyrin/coproporphyrin ferrochelatase